MSETIFSTFELRIRAVEAAQNEIARRQTATCLFRSTSVFGAHVMSYEQSRRLVQFFHRAVDADQREKLKAIIRNGAVAYGFDREQRTSKRVRLVIFEQQFHVEYNSNDVCEILSHLGRCYGNTAQ